MKKLLALGFAIAVAMSLPAADAPRLDTPATQVKPVPRTAVNIPVLDDKVKLSVGDAVSFRILEDRDEAPSKKTITDTGELEITALSLRVKAVGKTCREVAEELKPVLEKDFYYHATIELALETINKRSVGEVFIFGEVKVSPAVVEIPNDEPLTLSKAIIKAGGFGQFANRAKILVTHAKKPGDVSKTADPKTIDLTELFEKGKTDKDIVLEPGDRINVPAKTFNF